MMQLFKQRRAINLLFIVLFLLGGLALTNLGTAELPEPPGTGLRVSAILPGASPEEMDLKVARLLHAAIKDIPGVDEVKSDSRESQLLLAVKFVDGHHDVDELATEISQLISQVVDLPPDLEGPYVSRPVNRIFPAMTLVLKGGADLERHNAWYEIKQVLKNIKHIEHIETLGDREKRVEIQFDQLKLLQLGVRIDQVVSIVEKAITDQSAGRVETLLSLNRIRVSSAPKNIEQLSAIPIKIDNGTLALGQVAEISEVLSPEKLSINYKGDKAWYINIFRRQGSNISMLSEATNQVIKQVNAKFERQQQSMRLIVVQDRSFIVSRVLGELAQSIILGMSLVVLILWCFFGIHNAFYAAIGIPFSFVVTFIVMDVLGIGLNTFTLFGLVLVCGMIVDDSIVVLENICSKLEQGISRAQAIRQGLVEVMPAVFSSTGTTIAAFLPLLLMTGGMGDFISQIPKVAILALIASLVECFIILPVHIYQRRNKSKSLSEQQEKIKHNYFNRNINRLASKMAHLVSRLLKFPGRVIASFFALLLITSTLAYFTMDFKLFDDDEVRSIRVHLTFPKTTDLPLTRQLMTHKRKALESIPQIKDVIILNGWSDYNYNQLNRSHLATIELLLKKSAYDFNIANEVSLNVKRILENIPGLEKLNLVLAKNKPPISAPVKIFLYGNDDKLLAKAYENVASKLAAIPSIKNISNPLEDGIPESVFNVNKEMAAYYDLQPKEIGQLLHMSVTGKKIAKLDRGDEVVDIYAMAKRAQDWQSSGISHITLQDGQVIALSQLGHFSEQLAPDVVKRFNGQRYISITADIDQSILSVFKTHREIEKSVTDSLLPEGVSFEQLGEFSSTQKSLTSMFQSALLALGLCYFILSMLFRSYTQPLVVLLTIPLAYIGVIWGMTLMGRSLSLFGLVGIIGLIGIVVNDSLVWISCYNQLKQKNKRVSQNIPIGSNNPAMQQNAQLTNLEISRNCAVEAVKLRFRPIMLTTITTIFGLLPVSLSGSAGIAGSMAVTILSGLLAASLLLLIFLPICVVIIDDINERINRSDMRFSLKKIMFFLPRKAKASKVDATT
ncbi:efflux RND transporter permease subunit [Aliikangiella sp. IMCC44359]|uniref:efflux RND transporter permease subunit n=1 Tax=Aliikangiella sp. IMCC44359 TaxID=3459125 RepID=UPI00403B2CA5